MPRQVLQVRISGKAELDRALQQMAEAFGTSAGERALTAALSKVAQPIVRDARRLAPKKTGALRRSIKVRPRKIRVGGGARRRYRRIAGTVNVRPTARHAHLVEFGTAPRRTKSGAFRGQVPARPYMRPAWERHRAHLNRDLGPLVWAEVRKQAARYRARSIAKRTAGGL